jgi:hypothetical protein
MFNRTQNSEFINFKLLKNSFLGTVFLLTLGASSFSTSSANVVENFEDPLTDFQFCNIMYPDDFAYFEACMGFGLD